MIGRLETHPLKIMFELYIQSAGIDFLVDLANAGIEWGFYLKLYDFVAGVFNTDWTNNLV